MRKNAVLISALWLCLSSLAIYGQDASRAGVTWQVQKYDMNVTLPQDPKSRSITVNATLDLKNVSAKAATTLTL